MSKIHGQNHIPRFSKFSNRVWTINPWIQTTMYGLVWLGPVQRFFDFCCSPTNYGKTLKGRKITFLQQENGSCS